MNEPDYGTYHHSSRENSEKLREEVKTMSNATFERLRIDRNKPLSILDVGCGNGFILSLGAMFFPKSLLTGIDPFSGGSLHGSSLSMSRRNMDILGMGERTIIIDDDPLNGKLNPIMSDPVLHNICGKRFPA